MVKVLKEGLQAIVSCVKCRSELLVGYWETTVADCQTHLMERQVECPVCKNVIVIKQYEFRLGEKNDHP